MSPRKSLQDMVPSEKKSIRNIEIRRTKAEPEIEEVRAPSRPNSKPSRPVRETKPKKSYKRSWIIVTFLVLIASIGLIVAAISLIFSNGTVVVKPKVVSVNVSTTQVAKINAVTPQLPFETITVTAEEKTDVPAVQAESVQKKAAGTVTFYNAYSSASQKIVASTRISNTEGKIYRTTADIVIPGSKTVGTKVTPGSITAKVVADKAGVEYNMSVTDLTGDFKIVAYQGTPKYSKIYARLKTEITGGYVGKSVTPNKTAKESAEKDLKSEVLAKLIADSKSLIPKGYTTFDGAYKVSYASIEPTASGTSSATVGIKGAYVGYVFKASDLVTAFAKEQVAQFPAESFDIKGLESLEFKLNSVASSTISFGLKGSIKLIGAVPVDKLKSDLAGLRISDSATIIRKYGTIGSAYAKIFPVWMRSLPNDPDRITIEIQSE